MVGVSVLAIIFVGYLRNQYVSHSQTHPDIEQENKKSIAVVFVGDIILDRYIRQIGEVKGYNALIEGDRQILLDSDVVVANLEGPIMQNVSRSVGSVLGSPENYIFTFDPQSTELLDRSNIHIVHLGNNHMYNFGIEGIQSTQKYLQQAEIQYFGALKNFPEDIVLRRTINGVQIAFISYNQFSGVPWEDTIQHIEQERQLADFVVVYAHWGTEYTKLSTEEQQEIAHTYIDAGADFIVGSHPHVVQNKETYNGKKIYYSLGNFIFDQYFSEDVQQGLMLRAIFNQGDDDINIQEIPVYMEVDGITRIESTP